MPSFANRPNATYQNLSGLLLCMSHQRLVPTSSSGLLPMRTHYFVRSHFHSLALSKISLFMISCLFPSAPNVIHTYPASIKSNHLRVKNMFLIITTPNIIARRNSFLFVDKHYGPEKYRPISKHERQHLSQTPSDVQTKPYLKSFS